jgi:hypothetical protein
LNILPVARTSQIAPVGRKQQFLDSANIHSEMTQFPPCDYIEEVYNFVGTITRGYESAVLGKGHPIDVISSAKLQCP